ncbi:hypothetical protein GCM10025789_17230 [Tessaracoccus lubricantis]|uniref:Activator of Hsp90 ATPase homologue 1/2-like C-terminal domain-containing protein n=1 Tax=Tessaracoccus lubricantis TaxID=545543 RepID=A0ABP9FEU6_9ACTN
MNGNEAYGTLETIDGRPALRFTLEVPYPVERVWQAVSDPAELQEFFPGAAPWGPETGEELDLGGMTLTVHEATAPKRLAWTFADQPQSFDLAPTAEGTRLTFTHVIDDLPAAQTATGWQTYLSRLEPHLAGRPMSEEEAHRPWRAIHEGYAAKFGVDPEPGRQWADQNLPDSAR